MSQEEVLYKRRFQEDGLEEKGERNSINPFLVLLIAVGLGLCCSMILFVIIFFTQSAEEDSTTVDTFVSFHVTKKPAPSVTSPSATTPSHFRNTSATFPDRGHRVPSPGFRQNECTGQLCRSLAVWLRYSLDHTVDPCKDFYKYVCAYFRGDDVFKHVATSIEISTLTDLISAELPASNQLSWQKAAALYQACMSFTSAYGTETSDLVNWMKSLNLDLLNKDTLATVNPVEMMVRGSLDLGVEAVISITFSDREFVSGKRQIKMEYSRQQDIWQAEKHGLNTYVLFLAEFGATSHHVYDLASKLRGYENHLEAIAKATRVAEQEIDFYEISRRTAPYVSRDDWKNFLNKYTNNTQLFEFTNQDWFLRGRSASDACYEHVKKVMKLAITSHYFQSVVPPRMVYQTKRMASRIRHAFDKVLQSSSWLSPRLQALATDELINITVYVGSPGRRLDPEYVEEIYKPFPDAPVDRLFPTWIKCLSLNTHLAWSDQKTLLYDETAVNAIFIPRELAVIVMTAIMHRPFLYLYGPISLNYGALGALSLSRQQEKLDDATDSENLCDLVGTVVAYAAYASLPVKFKSTTLAGLNVSSERLFFISHCLTSCAQLGHPGRRYAPFRSRCIVPLMNMPEFSNAFGCAPGTPMNPRNKCEFW
ncbi:hypothetical protein MTO96_031155 [Rhipicephalus appendiculatus]